MSAILFAIFNVFFFGSLFGRRVIFGRYVVATAASDSLFFLSLSLYLSLSHSLFLLFAMCA